MSFLGLTVAALIALCAATAEPHASLVKSIPARDAVLSAAPLRVDLWFNEPVDPTAPSLSVWSPRGRQVDKQDVTVGPEDTKRVGVGLYTLRPGVYTVRFRLRSADGHVVEGSYTFTVSLQGQ